MHKLNKYNKLFRLGTVIYDMLVKIELIKIFIEKNMNKVYYL